MIVVETFDEADEEVIYALVRNLLDTADNGDYKGHGIKKTLNKKADDLLYDLWYKIKVEGNCSDYVGEMMNQLVLLGTERNTLTRTMVVEKMRNALDKIGG